MDEDQLIDMNIVNSLLELEKSGATGFFKKQVALLIERIPSYLENILESIDEKNLDNLSASAHRLNGFAASLGAKEVRHLCLELEKLSNEGSFEGCRELGEQLTDVSKKTSNKLKALAGIAS